MEESEYRKFLDSCVKYLREQAILRGKNEEQESLKRTARIKERESKSKASNSSASETVE